jgi:hypothetical protein
MREYTEFGGGSPPLSSVCRVSCTAPVCGALSTTCSHTVAINFGCRGPPPASPTMIWVGSTAISIWIRVHRSCRPFPNGRTRAQLIRPVPFDTSTGPTPFPLDRILGDGPVVLCRDRHGDEPAMGNARRDRE